MPNTTTKTVAILNSRQALRPSTGDNWVTKTESAVKWVKENNHLLYTSCGMSSWEILTTFAVKHQVNMKMFVPCISAIEFERSCTILKNEFNLHNLQLEFEAVTLPLANPAPEKVNQSRDKKIVEHSDIIFPISIRNRGNFDNLIKSYSGYGKTINNSFQTRYQKRKAKLAYKVDPAELNPELVEASPNYIVHWTRSFNKPWPDEKLIDYYNDIVSSRTYPRTAFASLKNILNKQTIFASSKNIPDQIPVVSFSAQTPEKMIELMRWRSRYHQMSFEPYGIAVEKDHALSKNVKPVIYYNKDEQSVEGRQDRWLYQSEGEITDWKSEMEYRHRGNFDLSAFDKSKLLLITYRKEEAEQLAKSTGFKVFSFTK